MARPSRFPDFWTEADLDDLPADGHRYEIVDGSLLVTPPPSGDHQTVAANVCFHLRLRALKGWRVVHQVGLRASGSNFVPDVVVLRPQSQRGNVWFDGSDVALVVEVASPSTETTDRGVKEAKYAQAGIPVHWRVGLDGTVSVMSLPVDTYRDVATVRSGEILAGDEPFRIEIDPSAFTEGL